MQIHRYTEHPTFGPYSPVSGVSGAYELLFVSSQIAYDEETQERYQGGDVRAHTWLAMNGLRRALEMAGSSLPQVLRITAYAALEDPDGDRQKLNAVYESYFEPGNLPSRTYVPLPPINGISVAFDAIAAKPLPLL